MNGRTLRWMGNAFAVLVLVLAVAAILAVPPSATLADGGVAGATPAAVAKPWCLDINDQTMCGQGYCVTQGWTCQKCLALPGCCCR
jgi:hypothetical protein